MLSPGISYSYEQLADYCGFSRARQREARNDKLPEIGELIL